MDPTEISPLPEGLSVVASQPNDKITPVDELQTTPNVNGCAVGTGVPAGSGSALACEDVPPRLSSSVSLNSIAEHGVTEYCCYGTEVATGNVHIVCSKRPRPRPISRSPSLKKPGCCNRPSNPRRHTCTLEYLDINMNGRANGEGVDMFGSRESLRSATGSVSKIPHYVFARDTVTSRRRRTLAHISHTSLSLDEHDGEYLTPFQRKDRTIRDLKTRLREVDKALEVKNAELNKLIEEKEAEVASLVAAKLGVDCELKAKKLALSSLVLERQFELASGINGTREEVLDLREELENLQFQRDDAICSHLDAVRTCETLQQQINALQDDIAVREKHHQDMYLKTFLKGQQSARLQHQEEIQNTADGYPNDVILVDLIEKLHNTEQKLGHWQTIKSQEVYTGAGTPQTETEVRLGFLRDSFFHFLTDRKDAATHLHAIIGIMGYSEAQLHRINDALAKNKKEILKNKNKK